MSKSITQDMAYRQSLMKYAEKYGVSRASRKQAHFAHNAEQTLWTTGVAALPQTVPQLDHAQRRIAAAHIGTLMKNIQPQW